MQPLKKLRIGMMVTSHFTIPPPRGTIYAPMDITTTIAQELAKRGHDITVYAPLGTRIAGVKIKTYDLIPLKQKKEGKKNFNEFFKGAQRSDRLQERLEIVWDQYLLAQMFLNTQKGEHDLLYISPTYQAMPLGLSHPAVPIVYTLHDPMYMWRKVIYELLQTENQHFVSISNAQRKGAPHLNYAGTVYNGVDLKKFAYSEKSKDYFLWVGRINRHKNPGAAVQAAIASGEKLLLVGTHDNDEYWKTEIEPFLNDRIQYKGFSDRDKLPRYYQGAKALLMPILWEEPFGLVMTEAMACGTPVIAYPNGSVPEIVIPSITGYLVKNSTQMAAAMKKIGRINRKDCRERVEQNFSNEAMVDGYEMIFKRVTESRKNIKKA